MTIVSAGNASGGTVVLNSNGTITFTPNMGGLAPCSFQYVISDGTNTASANVTVLIQVKYQWHNFHNPDDVNNDGTVSPIDALLVINWINAYGSSGIIGLGITATTNYYDVIADNIVAANDALHVVNTLNAQNQAHNLSTAAASGSADSSPARRRFEQRQFEQRSQANRHCRSPPVRCWLQTKPQLLRRATQPARWLQPAFLLQPTNLSTPPLSTSASPPVSSTRQRHLAANESPPAVGWAVALDF